jgi:hypothetical protein
MKKRKNIQEVCELELSKTKVKSVQPVCKKRNLFEEEAPLYCDTYSSAQQRQHARQPTYISAIQHEAVADALGGGRQNTS